MVAEAEPLVSIITLNYNQTALTCAFLESTRQLDYPNYEILVCDMASAEDPSPTIGAQQFPKTTVLRSRTNLGFAAGNNWGMQAARGDFLLLVNNDTEVAPNLVIALLTPFSNDPTLAAVSPKIVFHDKPTIIQYAGFNAMNFYTGRTSTIGEGEADKGQYNEQHYTYAAHGCAMMIKRSSLEQTGGLFPASFFLYYEEWDWSARARKAGLTIAYTPATVVRHKESQSVGKFSPLKTYYLTRNRILFIRRNAGPLQLAVFVFYFALAAFPIGALRYALQGDWKQLKAFLSGIAWNLRNSSRTSC